MVRQKGSVTSLYDFLMTYPRSTSLALLTVNGPFSSVLLPYDDDEGSCCRHGNAVIRLETARRCIDREATAVLISAMEYQQLNHTRDRSDVHKAGNANARHEPRVPEEETPLSACLPIVFNRLMGDDI